MLLFSEMCFEYIFISRVYYEHTEFICYLGGKRRSSTLSVVHAYYNEYTQVGIRPRFLFKFGERCVRIT